MADRTVKVGLRADVTPYISAIQAAERATTRWADRAVADATRARNALGGVGGGGPGPAGPAPVVSASASAAQAEQARLAKQAEAMDTVGTAATTMGAAIAGGFLMSAKAAIDWETAWAGVTKTVDGSAQEMAALESELRGMAKTLPIAHKEIAAVAEAAGQLGVKRADIAGFTKTMVDLGVSTNLSADEAATAIAQMTNVMGTAPKDVSRLGAALVALGNDGASTERDIMSMASRLAGAGKLVGATEAGVLAMANAMSSVGIEAELGGGSMSRTLTKMYTAVKTTGAELDSFAKTAGMSADEFAAAFQADPMRAISAFTAGLARIKAEGGNVVAALGEVKIKGTQDLQVLLRLAGASDMLADSLDLGAQAWEQNSALSDEAGKRYATVASKLTIAKNNLVDLAIQIGDVLLPVVAKMADAVSAGIDLFQKMPGPIREIAVVLGALGGAMLLFGGALLLTIPRIVAVRAALQTLAATAVWTRITTNLSLMSGAMAALMATAAGPWVLAFAAAAAAVGALLLINRKSKPPIDDLTAAIKADTGALEENTRKTVANRLEKDGALKIADKFAINLADVTAATMGNAEAQERLNAAIAAAKAPYEAQVKAWREIEIAEAGTAKARKAQYDARILQTEGELGQLRQLEGAVNANADATRRAVVETDREIRASKEAEDQTTRTAAALDDRFNRAMGRAAAGAREAAGASSSLAADVKRVGAAADAAEADMKGLNTALDDLFETAFGLPRALDKFHKGLNDLVAQAKSGSKNLRGFSNSAIGLRESLFDVAEGLGGVATEMLEAGVPADEVADKIARLRKHLLNQADAAGLSRSEVDKLIGVLKDVPETITSRIGVETDAAVAAIDRIQTMIDNLRGKNIPITFSASGSVNSPGGGRYTIGGRTMADGGMVRGPGGPRDDAIPAWLSDGEFVVNAAATARHRLLLEHVNAGRFAAGGPVRGRGGWEGPALMPKTLKGLEKSLDKLEKSLGKLDATIKADKLGAVRKESREFAAAIKSAFVEAANITSLPGVGGTGAQMLSDLQTKLDRATAFTGAMDTLRKRGLNETALAQIRTAGAEGGGLDAAQQLLNGGDISQVNALMRKIADAGKLLGGRESRLKYGGAIREAAKEREELLAERRMKLARQAALVRRQKEMEKAEEAEKDAKVKAAKTRKTTSRTTSSGQTLSAVSAGGNLAPLPVKITFDVTGSDKHMKALIRHIVRTDGGGSVQKAFGTG